MDSTNRPAQRQPSMRFMACTNNVADIDQALKGKARMVLADERAFDSLPDAEQVIVALILDRADLLPRDYTMLDAFDRLGPELAEAAVRVQRARLHCEEAAHG